MIKALKNVRESKFNSEQLRVYRNFLNKIYTEVVFELPWREQVKNNQSLRKIAIKVKNTIAR